MIKIIFISLFLHCIIISNHLIAADDEETVAPLVENRREPPLLDIRDFFNGEWDLEIVREPSLPHATAPLHNRTVRWSFAKIPHSSSLAGNSSEAAVAAGNCPLLIDFPDVTLDVNGKPTGRSSSRQGAIYTAAAERSVLLLPHLAAAKGRKSGQQQWQPLLAFDFRLVAGSMYHSSGSYAGDAAFYQLTIINPNSFLLNILTRDAEKSLHFVVARRVDPISVEPSFMEQYSVHLTFGTILLYHLYQIIYKRN